MSFTSEFILLKLPNVGVFSEAWNGKAKGLEMAFYREKSMIYFFK